VPNPSNTFPNGQAAWVAERHPEAIKKAAVLAPVIETTNVQVERLVRAYESVGLRVRLPQEDRCPPGELRHRGQPR
jgi:hypothetical protein